VVPEQRFGFHDEIVEVDHVAMCDPGDVFAIQPRFVRLQQVIPEPVPAESAQHPAATLRGHLEAVQETS